MSPPHPDRPLATQGGDEPPGFRREKDQGCKGLVSLAEDSHALSQAAAAGRQAVTPAVMPGELGWAHWFRPGTTVTPFGGFGIDVTLCLAGLEPRGNDQQG